MITLNLTAYSAYCHFLNTLPETNKLAFDKLPFFDQVKIAERWVEDQSLAKDRKEGDQWQ